MQDAIKKLLIDIYSDYERWINRGPNAESENCKAKKQRFKTGLSFSEGPKYIRIINDGSVWAFIVKNDDGKFRRGDILKAAGWKTPARNQARGNILDGYAPRWLGPATLR